VTQPRIRIGTTLIVAMAALEHQYGRARPLLGDERRQVAEQCGAWPGNCAVIDIGGNRVAIVRPRAATQIHDLGETGK
jgi:hypothetical protein